MHVFIVSFLLGLAASAPIGPVNLEIIRRSLAEGIREGAIFGIGACFVDATYVVLISLGLLSFLNSRLALTLFGIIGALILGWFAYRSFTLHSHFTDKLSQKKRLHHHLRDGYFMTVFNPFTVLFWTSVSTQIARMAQHYPHALLWGASGVLVGTLLWVVFLSGCLAFSRRFINDKFMNFINKAGGLMLGAIAVFMLIRAVFSIG